MKRYIIICLLLCTAQMAAAQVKILVRDSKTKEPIAGINIISNNAVLMHTDSLGAAIIPSPVQPARYLLSGQGFEQQTVQLLPSDTQKEILLVAKKDDLEEVTIIATTRTNDPAENSPIKIEVLGKEEMSEEAGIKPGNIASILGDVSGVQIQQSSATTGNSNIRIQGLDGRYTQILRDGMPLYDGFSGGLGIMTIPPLDLQQIELVKGSASTLYGGGAIGGLVNLISRRPGYKQELDALINYSSLTEANANVYTAKRYKKTGYTLFAGYTSQQAVDVNKDGLSDVPQINSLLVHPKLFFYPTGSTTFSIGYSGSFDQRKGGDMQVLQGNGNALHQYFESSHSRRNTIEYTAEQRIRHARLSFKGNYTSFYRYTNSNTNRVKGLQNGYYNELSIYQPINKSNLVAGINSSGDDYKTLQPDTAALRRFSNNTLGAFAQLGLHIKDNTVIETGLRLDHHARYGFFLLPRIALFHRFDEHWATRAGFGMGYKTPNPLVPQNIEYSVTQLAPISSGVMPELSYGYNAEVNYKKEWSAENSLFINQAFFLTQVNSPILFEQGAQQLVALSNAAKPLLSMGFDTYAQLKLEGWELYLGYTYTDARRTYLPANSFVPLTPRNRMACVLVKELESKWRFGLEGSYMGSQYRYDGSATPDYVFLAAMIQRNIGGHLSIVLNGENLLDYRMSRVETLYTGSISNPGFKPLWAPIDGRVINLSVRWKL